MVTLGIDYGSKLAGTTALVWENEHGLLECRQSEKKKDADRFILQWVERLQPDRILIDAPLSLPGVYRNLPGYSDYFYRKADREAGAMSPMFLGGLTARAMQLCRQLQVGDRQIAEVYPGGLARLMHFSTIGYKKDMRSVSAVLEVISDKFQLNIIKETFCSWHAIDALLAYCAGYRIDDEVVVCLGDPKEGQLFY